MQPGLKVNRSVRTIHKHARTHAAGAKDTDRLHAAAERGFPVLLLWAEDDGVAPIASARAAVAQPGAPPALSLFTAPRGGHAVLPVFGPRIVQCLEEAGGSA